MMKCLTKCLISVREIINEISEAQVVVLHYLGFIDVLLGECLYKEILFLSVLYICTKYI